MAERNGLGKFVRALDFVELFFDCLVINNEKGPRDRVNLVKVYLVAAQNPMKQFCRLFKLTPN
jgi:hypothetical protein